MVGTKLYSGPNPINWGYASSVPSPLKAAAVTVKDLLVDQVSPGEASHTPVAYIDERESVQAHQWKDVFNR